MLLEDPFSRDAHFALKIENAAADDESCTAVSQYTRQRRDSKNAADRTVRPHLKAAVQEPWCTATETDG